MDRIIQQSELPLGITEIAVNLRIVGPEFEREPVGANRLRVLAELQVRIAEIVERLGRARIDLQGSLVPVDRLTNLPERLHRVGGVDQRLLIVWCWQLECAAQVRQSFRPLFLVAQERTQIAVRIRILRHQLGRSAQHRQRVPALPHQRDTQNLPQHPGIRMRLEQQSSSIFRSL